MDENNDGAWDIGDTLVDTGLTDATCDYEFTGLAPDDYTVGETQQTGWVSTNTGDPDKLTLDVGALESGAGSTATNLLNYEDLEGSGHK